MCLSVSTLGYAFVSEVWIRFLFFQSSCCPMMNFTWGNHPQRLAREDKVSSKKNEIPLTAKRNCYASANPKHSLPLHFQGQIWFDEIYSSWETSRGNNHLPGHYGNHAPAAWLWTGQTCWSHSGETILCSDTSALSSTRWRGLHCEMCRLQLPSIRAAGMYALRTLMKCSSNFRQEEFLVIIFSCFVCCSFGCTFTSQMASAYLVELKLQLLVWNISGGNPSGRRSLFWKQSSPHWVVIQMIKQSCAACRVALGRTQSVVLCTLWWVVFSPWPPFLSQRHIN